MKRKNSSKEPQNLSNKANRPMKIVFKMNRMNISRPKETKDSNNKPTVNKINVSKKNINSNHNKDKNNKGIRLSEALSGIYKEYQLKNVHWSVLFKEQLLNDTNFAFDFNKHSVKSLNEKSSELLLNEIFWILLIEYYNKHHDHEQNDTKDTLLDSVISLFDQGLNYITEAKFIVQFYYDSICALAPGLTKAEMLELLNANSQYILQECQNAFKGKKTKTDREDNGKIKPPALITSKQELEFIPLIKHDHSSQLNNAIPESNNDHNSDGDGDGDGDSDEDGLPQDDKCLSTICNPSSTAEYQHLISPHLMHIKEESSEEKEKEKDFDWPNGYDGEEEEIIPKYEQKKFLKVKELMKEIEAKYSDKESTDQFYHPIPLTGTKRNQTTPSKSRFSPREEYPIDLVEGSIQKFNHSFV